MGASGVVEFGLSLMESARLMGRTSGHWKRWAALGWDRVGVVGSLRGIRGRDGVALDLCYASDRRVLGGEDGEDGEDGENGGGKAGKWKGQSWKRMDGKGKWASK
jgi:hypothetical protein